ncbi:MAG: MurR/RpiR family transcriptional regulator [Synergistaceae bacterium]|jgi:DNA-binding MurR/RpiR family transcriptional regulator|nr:MurR/RpiR family transcriptional regulator [Synergistaceae bacterium]
MERKLNSLDSSDETLLERLKSKNEDFSPKQYILARFIAQNYEGLAYSSITELSFATSVSEPSITRFARLLGYRGFPGLQAAIRAQIGQAKSEHSLIQDFKQDFNHDFSQDFKHDFNREEAEGTQKVIDEIFALESKSIENTYRNLDPALLEQATDFLVKARKVVATAAGLNYFFAEYAASYLSIIRKDVAALTRFDIPDFAVFADLSDDDVVLAFSFPRYPTKMNAILKTLRSRNPNTKIIVISDSVLSPAAAYANCLLLTPQWTITFVDAYAAAMILVHTLLYSVFLKNGKDTARRVREYDKYVLDENLVKPEPEARGRSPR